MPDENPEIHSVALSREERAARASIDVEAKRKVLEAAIEHRDRMVLELYDAGFGLSQIGKVMHLSHSRIVQIVGSKG